MKWLCKIIMLIFPVSNSATISPSLAMYFFDYQFPTMN